MAFNTAPPFISVEADAAEAEVLGTKAGLTVVMNQCPKKILEN